MFRKIAFISASIICLLNIALWPVNKYEWMLDEDPNMTLPVDGNTSIYALLAIAPVFLLLLFLIRAKHQSGIITILVFIALLTIGLYKYRHLYFFPDIF